ncbi:RagB/SusD family nutrient uptake outer membrane protein [Halosquirtibacter xylanolyticus]|uniref:RagB/SusD family nutrient uptake outer membrane protein n=1 Tax=Halosquirtibacter xylanolyticus TaxID=3374599 RepID=UPI003749BDBF|nr:RagB/SusD family nutrient uptake outer membrane protein [Prolixibacteraceae bacterium]
MKKVLYLALIVNLLLSSCSDSFLEQTSPNNITTSEFWKSEKDVKQAMVACYSDVSAQSWLWGELYMALFNYKGDDVDLIGGSIQYGYLSTLNSFQATSDNSVASYVWKLRYRALRNVNNVITNLPNVPSGQISDEKRAEFMSEAHFLRGLLHFDLLINFKQIIIRDQVVTLDNVFKALSSREDAWDFVIKEFKAASTHLPKAWDDKNVGRATKGAAWGYLGKAYLFRKNYTEAIKAFEEVKKLGYDLTENYEGMFNGTNENSKESLFEVQYTSSESGGMTYYASSATFMGISEINGWNMIAPSEFLISEYEKERTVENKLDKRLLATICYNDPDGESMLFGKTWKSYFEDGVTPKRMFKKYIDGLSEIISNKSGVNLPMLRYADVLLMYAEALNESGGDATEILKALNKVRGRAGLKDFEKTDQTSLRLEIRHQRFLEFPMESIRFQDLVRYGDVKQTLVDNQHPYASNYTDDQAYYDVPAVESAQNNLID